MHPVKPPQERDSVISSMPDVHPAIKKYEGQNEGERDTEIDGIQKAKLILLSPIRHYRRDRTEHQPEDHGVEDSHGKIADCVSPPAFFLAEERSPCLPAPE